MLPCVIGEVFAGVIFDGCFEQLNEVLEVFDVEFGVELDAFLSLDFIHDFLEGIDVGFALGLHAENYIAVHLDEAAVAVPCEAGIAALFGQGGHGGIVHAEVEDGVHHTGHRGACTRAYRNKQGIGGVVEFLAGEGFDVRYGFLYVFLYECDHFVATMFCVLVADFGSDGEAGGHGHAQEVHLSEVGAFAAEEIAHLGIAFGFTVTECINSFHWLLGNILVKLIDLFPVVEGSQYMLMCCCRYVRCRFAKLVVSVLICNRHTLFYSCFRTALSFKKACIFQKKAFWPGYRTEKYGI